MRRKWSAPRRGSLAFSPRCRANEWIARVKTWPDYEGEPKPLGFAGYKAGMVQVAAVDNKKGSLTFGKEVVVPATVIETPPMIVCGIRAYKKSIYGLKILTEAWIKNPPKDLNRLVTLPDKFDSDTQLKKLESQLEEISQIRLLVITQPRLAKRERKKPELVEIKIGGGSIQEEFTYAKNLLGKEIKASEILKNGEWVDVLAVTKGKGTQGPVKRWGVKKLPHKSRKRVRGVGSIGPWTPNYVMRFIPRAGQMGFHKRTEYNKQVLHIGNSEMPVTPKGGFVNYGTVGENHVILKGSVPGPKKRLIAIRYALRPPASSEVTYEIDQINIESQQGNKGM